MTTTPPPGEEEPTPRASFWVHLQETVSLSKYCPQPAADIAVGQQDDVYVLKNPHAGTYMRLSPEEYTLWTWMDGQRTVQELAVTYFLQHQRFMPVAELVRQLRRGHMLADSPVDVQAQLQAAVQRQAEPWGRRVLGFLWGHPIYLRGTDRFFRTLYRLGGRLLFTKPVILLQRLLALAGFVAFVILLIAGRQGYEVLQAGRSYVWGLLLLVALNAVTLSLHECAHALATIHYGCEVRRGGFMLYLGLPTLFVDTTDTWMVGKDARIQVAVAGPWSDLVLGGLGALLAMPSWDGGPLLLKIAALAYTSALFNLNPLLELDGYYALCDKLELPTLRRDALAFVGRDLWGRLSRRQALSSSERLYTIYGLLSLGYLVVVASLIVLFWRTQVSLLVADLLRRGVWGQVALGGLVALVGVPLAVLVGRRLYRAGRRGWRALVERGYLAREHVRLALMVGVFLALALLFLLLPASWQQAGRPFLPLLLYGLGWLALLGVLPAYQGTRFRWVLLWLAAVIFILGSGSALELVGGVSGAGRDAARAAQVVALLAALWAFSPEDLVRARAPEWIVMTVLLGSGFLLAIILARAVSPSNSLVGVLWVTGPVFLGGMALTLLVPTIASFVGTPFTPSWLLVPLALILSQVRCFLELGLPAVLILDLAVSILMAQAAILYLLAQRYLVYHGEEWAEAAAIGTQSRLRHAFAHFFRVLFALFRDAFGRRKAQVLDDRLDVIAVTANWVVAVDSGRVRESAEGGNLPLEELAIQYTDLFERTVEIMDDLAGQPFLRRAVQSAYDGLPWAEREVLAHWVLGQTCWGEAVSRDFFLRQDTDFRLLAGVALFFGSDEATLTQLRTALHEERIGAGQVIARQGEAATALRIVASGEVEVWQESDQEPGFRSAGRGHLINELHRGDTFGEDALLEGSTYRATYRASIETTLFRIEGEVLERFLQDRELPSEQVRTRARLLSWLTRLELFQGLPWRDLHALTVRMQCRQVPAWETVIREGESTDAFYLIEKGKVLIVTDWGGEREQIRAEIGSGEYFGEISPFTGGGATATVLATEPCTFWILPHREFNQFLGRSLTGV